MVPGRSDPVATDPFMLDIVAWENADNAAAYATPSFCHIEDGVQVTTALADHRHRHRRRRHHHHHHHRVARPLHKHSCFHGLPPSQNDLALDDKLTKVEMLGIITDSQV